MKLLERILSSFENAPGGFSARKLTAFVFTVTAIVLQFVYGNQGNVVNLVIVDGCIALLSLGIITAEQVIRLKNDTHTTRTTRSD